MSRILVLAGIFLITVSLVVAASSSDSSGKEDFSARYGGGGSRPRPRPPANAPAHHQHYAHQQNFVSVPVPSPTHAYPTFVRVPVPSPAYQPVRFPTNHHTYQAPPKPAYQYQAPVYAQHNIQYTYHQQPTNQQQSYVPAYQASTNQQQSYVPTYQASTNQQSYVPAYQASTNQQQSYVPTYQASTNQQTRYVPAPSYQPVSSSSQHTSHYAPSPAYQVASTNQQVNYAPIYQSSNQQLSYITPSASHTNAVSAASGSAHEPCTNAGWTPIAPVAVPAPSTGTSFRYQQDSSNNRVVVLSPEVVKTLMSMSSTSKGKSAGQTTVVTPTFTSAFKPSSEPVRGIVDNAVSASSSSSVVASGVNHQQQPSVKLVGYIGAASDKTPPGYIQLPVTKSMLRQLGGNSLVRQVETDFKNTTLGLTQPTVASSSSSDTYSLFTLKSVNDIQQLLNIVQGSSKPFTSSVSDLITSESQNVPMGLVVSNDQSSSFGSSGDPGASIQLVGHVSSSTPDVKQHFSRRIDDDDKAQETKLKKAS